MSFLQRKHLRRSETRPGRRFGVGNRVTLRCEQFEDRTLLSGLPTAAPAFLRFAPPVVGPLAAAASTDSATPLAGFGTPFGITPAEMRAAYGMNSIQFGSIVGDGTGQTIAIVDAFDDPNIAADLIAFDAQFHLTDPNFVKEGVGGPTGPLPTLADPNDWGIEISLDVEWAHVMAPNANILLVEASSDNDTDLLAAVDTARNTPGVSVVTMSWGGDEFSGETSNDSHFMTPAGGSHVGVTFLASTGDSGAFSGASKSTITPEWPAISSHVVAVGGTHLTLDSSGKFLSESDWENGSNSYAQSLNGDGGGGGGISKFVAQPSYQNGVVSAFSTTRRTIPDVAIDADPSSGVPIYDSYDFSSWQTFGGTSLASPLFAGIVAVADQIRVAEGLGTLDGFSQTLPALYGLPTGDFRDITTGQNAGSSTIAPGVGYDLVTGFGAPIAPLVVDNLVGTVGIGSFSAAPTSVSIGNSTMLTAAAVKTTSAATPVAVITGVNFYLDTNGIAGLQIGSDTLVGAGVLSGNSWTLPASTSGLSIGNQTYYAVAADSAGFTSPALATTVAVSAAAVTIGAFSVNPSNVFTGFSTTTLTASNVTTSVTGAHVTSVDFYRESNSTAGLQTSGDTLLGPGIQNGTTWTLSTSATGLLAGNYTYYALAADSSSTSATASALLSVVTPTPAIGAFVAGTASVATGATVTLTASNVIENGGSVSAVAFYRESNGTAGFQSGDTFLGNGVANGTSWSIGTSTYGLPAGNYVYYAVAVDPSNVTSIASTASVIVHADTSGLQRLRIATYNMSADQGTSSPPPGFAAVLEGIGQETEGGLARPIDLVSLEETTSNALSVAPVVSALNTYYGGVAVYAASPYQATQFGSATSGNGPNALVYDTTTLDLLASVPLAVPSGSSNGEFRQVVRYEFQPASAIGSTGIFYVYVVHSDAGTDSSDVAARNLEAQLIRDDEATLPADARVLYLGDFEMSGPSDASYQTLTAATAPNGASQGAAVDPLVVNDSWSTNAGGLLTGPATALASRSDLVLATANAFASGGLDYVAGSYRTFGNDGSLAAGGSVTDAGNAALSTDLVQNGGPLFASQALLGDLSTASTHLPVVADFTVPLTPVGMPGIAALAVSPGAVASGGAITLTASGVVETGGTVANVALYLETNGTTGFQLGSDTFLGNGVQNGTTWSLATNTAGLAAGTYTYYAVATDTGSGISPSVSASLSVSAATTMPVIGSFAAIPGTVSIGTAATLTASDVTEPGGTIFSVSFYREFNGIPGLQIGSDTLVGAGTQNGTTWTVSAPTTGLTAAAYTYYAFATDASNVSSTPLVTSLIVTPTHASVTIASWNVLGQGSFGTQGLAAISVVTGVTNNVGLTRGPGVSTSGAPKSNAWGGVDWDDTSANGLTDGDYVTFGVAVGAGETLSISGLTMNYRRSTFGPKNGYWQYQINGGSWNLIGDFTNEFSSSSSTGATMTPLALDSIAGLQNLAAGTAVTFRVVPYGTSGSGNTWYVFHKTAPDLAILGSVVPAATVTLADAGPAPSLTGQSASFNIHVAGSSPTGSVALEDADNGDAVLGTATLSSGSATIATSSLAGGTHHLIAVYVGDANNASNQSATLAHTVLFGTATTLHSSAASTVFGQPVTLSATVAASAVGATGTVQFVDGSTVLGIVTLGTGGVATLNVSSFAVGSHSVTASYSGDASFVASTSTAMTQTVGASDTSTSALSSEPIANAGDNVTFTAQVTATAPGSGIPTGTVQFTVDGADQDSPVALDAAGKASLAVANLSVGPHLVAAIYDGDSNFAGSTSVSISQTVGSAIESSSAVVNGDHPSPLVGEQRSEVSSILYTFNQAVSLTPDSFQIAVTFGQTGSVPTLMVAAVAGSGNTKWLVTFAGAGVNPATGSIADGVYDITLVAAKVVGGGGQMANDRIDTFFRLMGDLDGDGTVGASDFSTLISTFLRPSTDPNFIAAADLDGDGTVGAADFSQFVSNFLRGFSGFTATL